VQTDAELVNAVLDGEKQAFAVLVRRYERPGRLHHASPGWLHIPRCGIATCLNRATGTTGLSPAGLRPCRLLRGPMSA